MFLISSIGLLSFRAMLSIIVSIVIIPWGPPKPLNAVFETVLVLQQ